MNKIEQTVKKITNIDVKLMDKAQERLDSLTKPQGSLGRLEEIARLIVGISGKETPELKNKVIFTFASDHGVAAEGVSAYPAAVTAQMVYNFLRGGAGINVLAKHAGARVVVADLGVAEDLKISPGLVIKKIGYGTKNMAKGPAMTKEEAIKSICAGIEIFEDEFARGIDIIGTGEMGIANTTAASAITAVFTQEKIEDITGRGTGINDAGLKNKITILKEAIKINKPNPGDAIDVLAKVGGFEIGGLAGTILAAASYKVPVVIDGFISGAAALIAYGIEPKVKDYMFAAHCSVEIGHKTILKFLGLKPILDLNLRLGEGTGAALGIGIAEASIKILREMATFKNAGVSERGK
ncbi:MAG: nicotinate-nucleotide--dimethylbenzimidazole phosphoribosyltransferase [Candidatus Omnitrophota bacterium]|nr:nicotinate-nucleotide--dimethylbenzimidazole phosphoribosyltransferase [Candidatus Omnitrophota bacterium]